MRPSLSLVFASCLVCVLACGGGGDTGDSAPLDDTDAVDSAGDTATTPDTGTTTEPVSVLTELTDPCGGAGTPYGLWFEDEETGWVGCGNGIGLYVTENGGESFEPGHPSTGSGELYVNDIVPDPLGGMLVCGHDYGPSKTMLYRYRDGAWTELLHYGANWNDPTAAQMSNCGAVAAAGDGSLIVASETSGDITWSSDDGATWATEFRYWEDQNLEVNGYAYYYMLNLAAAGGSYFGAGSRNVEPPVFFGPTRNADGTWHNFAATVIDAGVTGEVWALATPDDGTTWFAGGRDETMGSASGFLYRSNDGGTTWEGGFLGGDLDIVHDLAFAADGRHGIAVGHRYPPASQGGFVLLTDDGGTTWTPVDATVPPLYSAAIVNETWWVAGDAYLARGTF
jgi:photosystem II stability/assembly factor-like uncharacterized protein